MVLAACCNPKGTAVVNFFLHLVGDYGPIDWVKPCAGTCPEGKRRSLTLLVTWERAQGDAQDPMALNKAVCTTLP